MLKAWRLFRGLTQDRLAERIRMTKTRVSLKERGLEPYDQLYLEAVARALETDPASLLGRDPHTEEDLRQLIASLPPATRARAIEIVRALKIADEKADAPPKTQTANSRNFVSRNIVVDR